MALVYVGHVTIQNDSKLEAQTMRNAKRKRGLRGLAVVGVVVAGALGAAVPAYAINDPRVPANECSSDNSVAVGDPLQPGNPGINLHTPQVAPFVSGNNPGVSTGALGQQNSNAIGTCSNSLP
jgi:hypothetical protein